MRDPSNLFGQYNIVQITPPPSFFVQPDATVKPYNPNYLARQSVPLYNPAHVPSIENYSPLEYSSPPLYSRGWRALELELEVIKNRDDIDAYIPNMRQLVAAYDWLSSNHIDPNPLRATSISRAAAPPITPNIGVLQIMFVAALLGIIAAVFLTLSLHAISTFRLNRE